MTADDPLGELSHSIDRLHAMGLTLRFDASPIRMHRVPDEEHRDLIRFRAEQFYRMALVCDVRPLSILGILISRGPRKLPIDGHEYARRRRARRRRA